MRVKRDDVLDAAAKVFALRGFRAAPLAEVGAELGISKSAVLYHFDSKEQLLRELVTPLIEDTSEMLGEWESPPTTLDGRIEVLTELMAVLIRHPRASQVLEADRVLWRHPALDDRILDNFAMLIVLLTGPGSPPDALPRATVAITTVFHSVSVGLDLHSRPITRLDSTDAGILTALCRDILKS